MSLSHIHTLSAALAFPLIICQAAAQPDVQPALSLVQRVTPQFSGKVRFIINNSLTSPVIEGRGNRLIISAPNVRECIRAYGYYLRSIANVHFSWNGDCTRGASFVIPSRKVTVPAALAFNYAFNYCTLSYTTVAWDKARWERELDILAMNGVQYILVTSGLEKVWQNFLRELEYPEDKIRAFIPNPCYAAWWNMGNLEGEGGPVSQSLIDNEAELGRFLVTRMREMGLEPVLQGYVGFLPHDFPRAGINGTIIPQGKWCGYHRPSVLQPTAPAFASIAALWYKHLHAVYGTTARVYGGDLFHEGGRKGNTQLDAAARAVQNAMQQASPGSTWVLQAWGHNPERRLLEGTDPNHTVILALQKDLTPRAQVNFNYQGRPFVWCELSNFGGKHGMFGGFDVVENLTTERSRAIGIGMISEGLETSPLFYALIWERMNTPGVINREQFLRRYTHARYGATNRQITAALHLLANSIYKPNTRREGSLENILCARPDLSARKASTWASPNEYYDPKAIENAARLYLNAGKAAGSSLATLPTYRYDLADLCRQVLADRARATLARCKQAYDSKDAAAFRRESSAFIQLIRDSAKVLATSEYFLLGRFIAGARNRATNQQDADAMEVALRRLITTWRPDISVLNNYSHRQFAEMMEHYYLPRWQAYFEARMQELNGGTPEQQQIIREVTTNNGERVETATIRNLQIEAIELAFPTADIPMLTRPKGDILQIAESILR